MSQDDDESPISPLNCRIYVSQDGGSKISYALLHSKLGHLNRRSIKDLVKAEGLLGITMDDIDWSSSNERCEICALAKIRQSRVPRKVDRMTGQNFKVGSMDIYGPVSIQSVGGNRYGLMYIDHESSYGFVEFLKSKEMQPIKEAILKWKLTVNELGYEMVRIQFDADSVFENEKFQEELRALGISAQYAAPGSHKSNGLVERMIQTVVAMARAMLIASGLPTKFWSYSLDYAMLIYNIVLKSRFRHDEKHQDRSPFMIIHEKKPLFNLPVFGCGIIARIPEAVELPSFSARGRMGVFLGIDHEHNDSCRYLSLESGHILVSKDVVIFEKYYGYTSKPIEHHKTQEVAEGLEDLSAQAMGEKKIVDVNPIDDTGGHSSSTAKSMESSTDRWKRLHEEGEPTRQRLERQAKIRLVADGDSEHVKYFDDENLVGNNYNEGYDMDEVLSYMMNVNSRDIGGEDIRIPQNFDEAMSEQFYDYYVNPIRDELLSHFSNESFYDCFYDRVPAGHHPVDSRWVFDIKRDANGQIKKYKARLVIRGFKQIQNESYFETFSPTVTKDSIRFILALAAMYDLPTRQLDFKTAFLNGILPDDEVIYCSVPHGFDLDDVYCKFYSKKEIRKYRQRHGPMFLRLKKSIYGTKQASRTWYKMLNSYMINLGYTCVQGDPSLYIKWVEDGQFILAAIFVDDVFATATDESMLVRLVKDLSNQFSVTDLGVIHQCLGMVVNRERDGSILLNNRVYIEGMIRQFQMEDCLARDTPAPSGSYLVKNESTESIDPIFHHRYRSLIGSLMFAAVNWRIDIMFRVSHLARFASAPDMTHMKAALYILRYLKCTAGHGLYYRRNQKVDRRSVKPMLIAWTDSNHAADNDCVSTSGYVIQLIHGPDYDSIYDKDGEVVNLPMYNVIAFSSVRQREVALSSTEAEYIASSLCCRALMHLKQLLEELGFDEFNRQNVMFVDNSSIILLANDSKVSSRFKHVRIKHHYIRWNTINGFVKLVYVKTSVNLADFLTKPNPGPVFGRHRDAVMSEPEVVNARFPRDL